MVKRVVLVLFFSLFIGMEAARAELIEVGTAHYSDGRVTGEYKLIYDDQRELTWLDYTHWAVNWEAQKAWAAGLNSALTIKLHQGWHASWSNTTWRLPAALNKLYKWTCDGTGTAGYNVISSELGYLFYRVLGNKGYYDASCNVLGNTGLVHTGPFENLVESWYWAGTDYNVDPNDRDRAWIFNTYNGHQVLTPRYRNQLGIGVRPGKLRYVPPMVLSGANSLLLWQP